MKKKFLKKASSFNPSDFLDNTKNKISSFYINFKKEKEIEKKRLAKKKKIR
mgnify:FL=1